MKVSLLFLALLAGAAEGKTLILIASQSDTADFANIARRYRSHYRDDADVEVRFVNLGTNLPYTQLSRQRLGNDNVFGRPTNVEYDRVVYLIDVHAMEKPQGGGLRFHFDDTTADFTAGSLMLKHLLEHAPRAKVRELILGSCNAGAFDPALFPGTVVGLSPADGQTRELDFSTFNHFLKQRGKVPPITAADFYRQWNDVMTTDRNGTGHAPTWIATRDGENVSVSGTTRMGNSRDAISVAHRRSLGSPGAEGMRGPCADGIRAAL